MEVIDSPAVKNGTLIRLTKHPMLEDDPPEIKAAKFLKLWHEYGQIDVQMAKYFGINRITVKSILEEIKTTTIYTQFLTEMHDSLDGMFSNSFKVNLFEKIKTELDEQRQAMLTARKKIIQVDHLELSPDGEIDRATNKGKPITNAEKRAEKKYWREQLHWHTHTYHKLLTDVMRENARWVLKTPDPVGKGKYDRNKTGVSITAQTETDLLKDKSLQ